MNGIEESKSQKMNYAGLALSVGKDSKLNS